MHESPTTLILGEFRRSVDDRYRLSLPTELMAGWSRRPTETEIANAVRLGSENSAVGSRSEHADSVREAGSSIDADRREGVLAKERPGCLSLWRAGDWQDQLESGIRVVESKLAAGRLGDRLAQVQTLGRLMSSRQREVQLAGRGRLVIPEGFRDFLAVEPGSEVIVVGAAICIEIWQTEAWRACMNEEIPRFGSLLDELSR